jgi:hypothetical protein
MEPILTKRQILVLRTLKKLGKVSILVLHEDPDISRKMTLRKLDSICGFLRVWGFIEKDWPKRFWITPRGESKIPNAPAA